MEATNRVPRISIVGIRKFMASLLSRRLALRRQRAVAPSFDTEQQHAGRECRHADKGEKNRVRAGRADRHDDDDNERDEDEQTRQPDHAGPLSASSGWPAE